MKFPIRDCVRAIGQQFRDLQRTGDLASVRIYQKALNETLVAHMRQADARTRWRAMSITRRLIHEAESVQTRELKALHRALFSGRMTYAKAAALGPVLERLGIIPWKGEVAT